MTLPGLPFPIPTDPLTLALFGGVVVVALLLVGAIVTAWTSRGELERLEQMLSPEERAFLEDRATREALRKEEEEFFARLNKRLEQTGWWESLRWTLSRAGLRLRPGEYLVMRAAAVVLGGLAGFLFGGRVRWLFTLLGVLLGFFGFGFYVRWRQNRRIVEFENQLVDVLNLLINSLRAGFSLLQAMDAVAKEMPPPAGEEFRRVVQEIQLGIPMEDALDNLLRRLPSPDLDLVVTAMKINRTVGGPLTELLETVVETIRERIRLKGEIRALTAQVRYSGMILALLPIALFLILMRIAPDYVGEFLRNGLAGYIVMGLALFLIGTGYYVMRRLGEIEV